MNIMDIIVAKKLSGGGGGTGTSNYNDLSNKPSINGTTLSGNKTAANLGLQVEITGDVTISSDNVDDTNATNLFVTSSEKSTWSGKQDALTFDDSPTESSNNPVKSGGVYTALSGKQAAITNDNKLNPALIDYDSTYAAVSATEKTTYSGKQDALTFDGTYSASTNKAATVSTVTNAVNALDVTGASNIAASKTISAWSETDGKVSISTQDIAITGSQAVLTGYAKTTGDVAAADTVTAAIGKLETKADNNQSNISTDEKYQGGVNLLEYSSLDTTNANGCTYTINADKSITINRTATSSSISYVVFKLNDTAIDVKSLCDGNHYLVGCPTGGLTTTYRMYATGGSYFVTDFGNGVLLTDASGISQAINVVIRVEASYQASNLTFKPMIITKTDYDAGYKGYQPYALSNAELTTNKQDILLTGYSATATPTSQQTIAATDSVVEGFEKLDNNVRLNESNILLKADKPIYKDVVTEITTTTAAISGLDTSLAANKPYLIAATLFYGSASGSPAEVLIKADNTVIATATNSATMNSLTCTGLYYKEGSATSITVECSSRSGTGNARVTLCCIPMYKS